MGFSKAMSTCPEVGRLLAQHGASVCTLSAVNRVSYDNVHSNLAGIWADALEVKPSALYKAKFFDRPLSARPLGMLDAVGSLAYGFNAHTSPERYLKARELVRTTPMSENVKLKIFGEADPWAAYEEQKLQLMYIPQFRRLLDRDVITLSDPRRVRQEGLAEALDSPSSHAWAVLNRPRPHVEGAMGSFIVHCAESLPTMPSQRLDVPSVARNLQPGLAAACALSSTFLGDLPTGTVGLAATLLFATVVSGLIWLVGWIVDPCIALHFYLKNRHIDTTKASAREKRMVEQVWAENIDAVRAAWDSTKLSLLRFGTALRPALHEAGQAVAAGLEPQPVEITHHHYEPFVLPPVGRDRAHQWNVAKQDARDVRHLNRYVQPDWFANKWTRLMAKRVDASEVSVAGDCLQAMAVFRRRNDAFREIP